MITGKILKLNGWPEGAVIRYAKEAAEQLLATGLDRDAVLAQLAAVRAQPSDYLGDPMLGELARACAKAGEAEAVVEEDTLRADALPYPTWGAEHIDPAARAQMQVALRLPISVAGALMPDAHVGYGVPIGAVLATEGAVIPYAVGVDIAPLQGDTLVLTLGGKSYPIRHLSERGEPFGVWACKPDGKIVAAMATAHQTEKNARLIRVTLDNGRIIECTPDHQFMRRDGTYIEAIQLLPGMSLMPFYAQLDQEGYLRVQQNYSGAFLRAHWIVARSGLLGPITRFEGQKTVIHHRNFNRADNRPSELEFMGNKDHASYHRSLVERNQHWQSDDFERHRLAALSAKSLTPEGLTEYRQRAQRLNEAIKADPTKQARYDRTEKHREIAAEIASRLYTCQICGKVVKSLIGLNSHFRWKHADRQWSEAYPGAKARNHQVVSVETLPNTEDVYCLDVPVYHNFALDAGVFVHNCRMRLSVYPVSPIVLGQRPGQFRQALLDQTRFGLGAAWTPHTRPEHPVLDDPAWKATRQLRPLQSTAYSQLGTSGTGNHFVEWGKLHLDAADEGLGLAAGDYLALLSHSGSRGVGFKIANYYSKLAESLHPALDRAARQLAWLPLASEAGAEYWLAMTLAGQFAAANHQVIHERVAKAVGLQALAVVENHHNFAWRATLPDGRAVIVHRKGATPAGAGVLGIIPGSMADPGYVVRGRGVPSSLDSASHGAGRAMGRQQALRSLTKPMRDDYLRARGVTLLGGGLDESPQAYKRIEAVMAAQADLVDVVGRFTPALVRMAEEAGDW